MAKGQVYKIHSDFYYVDDGVNSYECKVREVLKKQKQSIITGDFVEFDAGYITGCYPRKNFISRPGVANLDQVIVVSALKEPDLSFKQLNRFISLARFYNLETILCFNKDDLCSDSVLLDRISDIYEPLGFKIVFTSATRHFGLDKFFDILKDKTSVLCGTSGVGKSSLINAIAPDLKLKTKSISEKSGRGTHTTRHCQIIKINDSAKIVDTPGFSNVKFDFLMPKDVGLLFVEIKDLAEGCKYADCLHIYEDGCNVLSNIDKIEKTRYESYLDFVNEAKEFKEKVKNEGLKRETSQKVLHNRNIVKISGKKRQSARNNLKQLVYKEIENDE